MSRLVPYRSKAPAAVKTRIDETLVTTMYLVQTTGPTSYVVQEQNCDQKHKVLIGALQSCSCGDAEVCIHILFVMLKVLRVPATTPIVWQKSLIDSEIDALLRGDYREKSRAPPGAKTAGGGFLKKRGKDAGSSAEPQTETDDDAQRHALVEGEVCAICQEDMVAEQPLTFCRKGCGNNFHIECMKVFGESRKQSKEHIICPLCRHDWGDLALTELKKEMDVVNKAPNVHKNVGCKKCQAKPIRNERYRCVQCKNVDLCDRCFKMNAHINHSFVMKKLVADTWVPAPRSSQKRTDSITTELVEELQNRDLTTNDYDLLLQLDQREKFPIQDYLLTTLSGQKVAAANAKSFGEAGATCSLCRQSLRIQSDLRVVICGILFPGLHFLNLKTKKTNSDDANCQQQSSTNTKASTAVALDSTFCVMSLQNQAHPHHSALPLGVINGRDRRGRPTGKRPQPTTSLPSRPALPDFSGLSIGVAPGAQRLPSLPPLSAAPGSSSSSSRTRRSTNQSGGSPRSLHSRETEPRPASQQHQMVNQDATSADDRMKHAEQLRSELKNLDKERLRKQRLQREERVRQHHQSNNNDSAALNMLLPPIGQATVPSPDPPRHANQRPVPVLPSKSKPRQRAEGLANIELVGGNPLPELSIGGIKRA